MGMPPSVVDHANDGGCLYGNGEERRKEGKNERSRMGNTASER